MYKVLGVNASSGNYQGHDYSKLKLHCQKEFDEKITGAVGVSVEVVSVDLSNVQELLSSFGGDYSKFIGRTIDVYYNRYGKPDKIILQSK